ncbi:hypothetical protein ACSQ76_15590 [Roseovarius sp. B08]
MTLPNRFRIVALAALILGGLIADSAESQGMACDYSYRSGSEAAA